MQIKRTMALILAALLASSAVACGSSDANGAKNTTENDVTSANSDESVNETETSPYDALEDRDFEGRTFTILDANPNPQGLQINIPEDEMNGEVVNDALIIRDNAIEDRYNISIEYVSDTNADKVKSSVLAGDNEYDLVYSPKSMSSLRSRPRAFLPISAHSRTSIFRISGGVRSWPKSLRSTIGCISPRAISRLRSIRRRSVCF